MASKHSRNLLLERRLVTYVSLPTHKRIISPYKLSFRNRHISENQTCSRRKGIKLNCEMLHHT